MSATTLTTAIPTGTWNVDPSHSQVGFAVKHMGIATVRGEFHEFQGTLTIGEDGSASAGGTVKATSVDTGEPQRDDHLRSPDFFDTATYPQLSFESSSVEPIAEDTFRIEGELTIHGVTKTVELEAIVDGTDVDPIGNERVGLEVVGQISRGEFDMKFNQALGSGNMLVADKVKLTLDLSAVKQA
jgi:polyisoprenoid-binding protein YceI